MKTFALLVAGSLAGLAAAAAALVGVGWYTAWRLARECEHEKSRSRARR